MVLVSLIFIVISSSLNIHNEVLEGIAKTVEREEAFRHILENFSQPILVVKEGKVEFVNKQFRNSFKRKLRQLEAQTHSQCEQLGPEDSAINTLDRGLASKMSWLLPCFRNPSNKSNLEKSSNNEGIFNKMIISAKMFSEVENSASDDEDDSILASSRRFSLEDIIIGSEEFLDKVFSVSFKANDNDSDDNSVLSSRVGHELVYMKFQTTQYVQDSVKRTIIQIKDISN